MDFLHLHDLDDESVCAHCENSDCIGLMQLENVKKNTIFIKMTFFNIPVLFRLYSIVLTVVDHN